MNIQGEMVFVVGRVMESAVFLVFFYAIFECEALLDFYHKRSNLSYEFKVVS